MNKLTFKGKDYKLVEIPHHRFRVYDEENNYNDIGYPALDNKFVETNLFECYSIRIKDKFYALKLIDNDNPI